MARAFSFSMVDHTVSWNVAIHCRFRCLRTSPLCSGASHGTGVDALRRLYLPPGDTRQVEQLRVSTERASCCRVLSECRGLPAWVIMPNSSNPKLYELQQSGIQVYSPIQPQALKPIKPCRPLDALQLHHKPTWMPELPSIVNRGPSTIDIPTRPRPRWQRLRQPRPPRGTAEPEGRRKQNLLEALLGLGFLVILGILGFEFRALWG